MDAVGSDKRRVMIIDRSHLLREMVSRLLAHSIKELEITTCSSGREALDCLAQGSYHLVTTALMLPDMDGLDLCRQIRRSESHRFTPVVVISSEAESRPIKEGFDAGVTDYFDKSLGPQAFAGFITDFILSNIGLVGRVLYIEDSRSVAVITRRMLEKQGLQVTHLTRGEEAYAVLQRMRSGQGGIGFDLVIADYFLKGEMTGGDLMHAIRTRLHLNRQELPVLMMTGAEDARSQAELLHSGANDFIGKPVVEDVLIARVRSLLLIKQQYDALLTQAEKMAELAITDILTGLNNRASLVEHGESYFFAAENQPIWAIVLDVDHFKRVNDNHGHLVGDQVLATIGRILRRDFQDSLLIRFGGEEFAILLPRASRPVAIRRLESLRLTVAREAPAQTGVAVTISIGMAPKAEFYRAGLEELINMADQALYHSKENGRNRTTILTTSGAHAVAGAEVEADIFDARMPKAVLSATVLGQG